MSDKSKICVKDGESLVRSEKIKRYARYNAVFIMLIAAFVLITILNINSGSVHISVKEIFRIILFREGDDTAYSIIWKIRLPRIITSAILGGGGAVGIPYTGILRQSQ